MIDQGWVSCHTKQWRKSSNLVATSDCEGYYYWNSRKDESQEQSKSVDVLVPVFRQFGMHRKHHFQEKGTDVEEPPKCHVQEQVCTK